MLILIRLTNNDGGCESQNTPCDTLNGPYEQLLNQPKNVTIGHLNVNSVKVLFLKLMNQDITCKQCGLIQHFSAGQIWEKINIDTISWEKLFDSFADLNNAIYHDSLTLMTMIFVYYQKQKLMTL